jgi:hypothetical protein
MTAPDVDKKGVVKNPAALNASFSSQEKTQSSIDEVDLGAPQVVILTSEGATCYNFSTIITPRPALLDLYGAASV